MKKFTQFLAMAALIVLPFAMTSCDDDPWFDGPNHWGGDYPPGYNGGDGGNYGYDDDNTLYDMAATLCGKWSGTVESHEAGEVYSFNTDMVFYQNGSAGSSLKGGGTEYDYATNEAGEVESQILEFTWYIDQNTGNIYITYTGSGTQFCLDYSATQRGFYLSDQEFYGWALGVTYQEDYMVFNLNRSYTGAKSSNIGQTATTTTALFGSQADSVKPNTNLPQRLPKR